MEVCLKYETTKQAGRGGGVGVFIAGVTVVLVINRRTGNYSPPLPFLQSSRRGISYIFPYCWCLQFNNAVYL